MSDEKKNFRDPADNSYGGNDPRHIDLDDPVERAYWLKVLDVSEPALRAAVVAVGGSAQKVKDYLKQRR